MFRLCVLAVTTLLLAHTPAFAQTDGQKWWIDVNFGAATSAADDEAYVYTGTLFQEPYSLAAAYPKPSTGASFDVGVGRMITPRIGFGLSLSGTAHEDSVGLGATIPHPFFFNEEVVASAVTDEKLPRVEGGFNIQLMVNAVQTSSARVRLYAGPTFFSFEADMVRDLDFDQFATALSRSNEVDITGFEAVKTEGTGVGFHVGADLLLLATRRRGCVRTLQPRHGDH